MKHHDRPRRGGNPVMRAPTPLLAFCVLSLAAWAAPLRGAHAGEYDGLIVTGAQYGYGAQWGLYELSGTGQELRQVIRGGAFARYSPDRRSFVFARGGNLWLALADGSKRPCSAGELSWPDGRHVAWAPDGSAIYLPFPVPSEVEMLIDLLRVEMSAFRDEAPFMDSAIALGAPGPAVAFPAVSSSGTIAVSVIDQLPRLGLVSAHIYLRAGDGAWERITPWDDRHLETRPSFSASGEQLAFEVVDLDARRQRVFIYDLAKGTLTPVDLPDSVPDFMQNTWALGWQPNGHVLAIGWGQFGLSHDLPRRLGMWDGSEVRAIRGGSGPIRDVAWSPSGSQLAVIRDGSWRAPGASALIDVAIVVYDVDHSGAQTAVDIAYEVAWVSHLADFSRWDPVVPVDLEW